MIPPEIIMGEAGTCSLYAMAALAYVYDLHNKRFNGWQSNVSAMAEWVANNWYTLPNLTPGARYVFSEQDMRRPQVQRIIRQRGPPKLDDMAFPAVDAIRVFQCEGGLRLYFY
jgi:hypothetical protein